MEVGVVLVSIMGMKFHDHVGIVFLKSCVAKQFSNPRNRFTELILKSVN